MPNRKQVADIIGVGERQLQRYLKLASIHLNLFTLFKDKDDRLTGMPIESENQIELLKTIRSLLNKYKYCKNRQELIASELEKINKGENNVQI